VGVQMDDQTDERSGEPVDVAAVSAI
jgi:hypothetical protein